MVFFVTISAGVFGLALRYSMVTETIKTYTFLPDNFQTGVGICDLCALIWVMRGLTKQARPFTFVFIIFKVSWSYFSVFCSCYERCARCGRNNLGVGGICKSCLSFLIAVRRANKVQSSFPWSLIMFCLTKLGSLFNMCGINKLPHES